MSDINVTATLMRSIQCGDFLYRKECSIDTVNKILDGTGITCTGGRVTDIDFDHLLVYFTLNFTNSTTHKSFTIDCVDDNDPDIETGESVAVIKINE